MSSIFISITMLQNIVKSSSTFQKKQHAENPSAKDGASSLRKQPEAEGLKRDFAKEMKRWGFCKKIPRGIKLNTKSPIKPTRIQWKIRGFSFFSIVAHICIKMPIKKYWGGDETWCKSMVIFWGICLKKNVFLWGFSRGVVNVMYIMQYDDTNAVYSRLNFKWTLKCWDWLNWRLDYLLRRNSILLPKIQWNHMIYYSSTFHATVS